MRLPPKLWHLLQSRRFRICAACSPFLLVVFYGGVNAWGTYAENEWFRNLPARGIETRPEVYFGDGIPVAENALGTPEMVKWLGFPEARLTSRGGFNYPARNWQLGAVVDLAKMVSPPAASEQAAAENLLAKYPDLEADWPQVRQALRRPDVGFPGAKTADRMTSALGLRNFGDYALKHGLASLALNRRDEALQDIQAVVDLERHATGPRSTIGSVVVASMEQRMTCTLIWEGARRGIWDDGDLQRLATMLAALNPGHDGIRALRGEIAMTAMVSHDGSPDAPSLASLEHLDWKRMKPADWPEAKSLLRGLWLCVRPAGFGRLQIMERPEILIRSGLQEDGHPRERFTAADIGTFQVKQASSPSGRILFTGRTYSESSASGWSTLTGFVPALLQMQAELELARVGIALERYRLKHEAYPEKLDNLVPEFLPAVPSDPFAEQPLRYRRQEDGSPLVWSIGQNLMDDGGLPKRDLKSGDPVWLTRPIPDYSENDYNRD